MYIFLDNEIKKEQGMTLSINNEGLLYGWGLFETIRVTKGMPCFFDAHIQRLQGACALLYLSWDEDPAALKAYAHALIEANGIKEGRLRVSYFKNKPRNTLMMTTSDAVYAESSYEQGFSLWISETKRNAESLMTKVKSFNYLDNIFAKREAAQQGYDEALFLNHEGHLCEGAVSNLFWIKNGILYTPSVECGLLPGIIREKLFVLAKSLDMAVITGIYGLQALQEAEEVFITNSIMGIMPVASVKEQRYNLGYSSTTRHLMDKYQALLALEISQA